MLQYLRFPKIFIFCPNPQSPILYNFGAKNFFKNYKGQKGRDSELEFKNIMYKANSSFLLIFSVM